MRALPDPPVPTTDLKLDEDRELAEILNHPLGSSDNRYDYSAYEPVAEIIPDEQEGSEAMYAFFPS
jgi:hypothetical protein